jgi:hypothetical protein
MVVTISRVPRENWRYLVSNQTFWPTLNGAHYKVTGLASLWSCCANLELSGNDQAVKASAALLQNDLCWLALIHARSLSDDRYAWL